MHDLQNKGHQDRYHSNQDNTMHIFLIYDNHVLLDEKERSYLKSSF